MEHMGTKKIETERLLLRPFAISDAEEMFSSWANDDRVTKYLTWPSHKDSSVTRDILSSWIPCYQKKDYYNWAIAEKGTDRLLGNISVVEIKEESSSFQIGYCLSHGSWNCGYMSEALSAVIGFLFSDVGALRIEALHDVENARSGRVMERCGMTREGILRQYGKNNMGICDCAICSILRREWKQGIL